MLEINQKAPDFTLPDQDGSEVSLSDFRGKKVILYFYPKDSTPGCTKQALAFTELYEEFQAKDAVIIGISKDGIVSHKRFITKYNLPFILLSDPELNVIKAYDVWKEKKLYGKVGMGVERSTYIIDEEGMIIAAMAKVKSDKNPADVLAYLEEM